MKPKTVVLLAIAVGSGLLAMLGVQQAMSGGQTQVEEKVNVLVAIEDIAIGVQLTELNTAFREMPKSALPADPITDAAQYKDKSPGYAIAAGEILKVSRLKDGFGKAIQIPPGMRVVGIPVDDSNSQSGLLSPGDRVDVLVTYSQRAKNGRTVPKTMTLLEYVEVFATDDRTAREGAEADTKAKTRHVSLLLSPEQVPFVKLAESKGKLALAWRNPNDDVVLNPGSVDEELMNDLQGGVPLGDSFAGYDPYAPPLYGPDDGELGMVDDGSDFRGFGLGPTQSAEPVGAESGDVSAMLSQAEGTAPAPVATATPAPTKPQWNMTIYVGNDETSQSFDLPEPEIPAEELPTEAEMKALEEAVQGGDIWRTLKSVL
jgi:pilus assembly protein CpaB